MPVQTQKDELKGILPLTQNPIKSMEKELSDKPGVKLLYFHSAGHTSAENQTPRKYPKTENTN